MAPADRDVRAAILGDRLARDAVGRWLFEELRKRLANGHRDDDKFADLLQSVMVVVWANKSGKAPHDAAGFLRWAVGVTLTVGMATRRLARRAHHHGEAMHALMPEPERPWSPDSIVDLKAVAECVDELATPHRNAVIARVQEHTPARLAAEQGVEPDTIRRRYNRAVDQIKQTLAREAQARKDALEHQRSDKSPKS